jgi:hypothetical protein
VDEASWTSCADEAGSADGVSSMDWTGLVELTGRVVLLAHRETGMILGYLVSRLLAGTVVPALWYSYPRR